MAALAVVERWSFRISVALWVTAIVLAQSGVISAHADYGVDAVAFLFMVTCFAACRGRRHG